MRPAKLVDARHAGEIVPAAARFFTYLPAENRGPVGARAEAVSTDPGNSWLAQHEFFPGLRRRDPYRAGGWVGVGGTTATQFGFAMARSPSRVEAAPC
jgi:hypothetical protein